MYPAFLINFIDSPCYYDTRYKLPCTFRQTFGHFNSSLEGKHVQSRVGEILEKLFDENCQGRLIPICSKHSLVSLVGNLYFVFGTIALDSFSVYRRPGLPYLVCLCTVLLALDG